MAFCFVPQPRLTCAEYFASQLVVEATLVQIKTLHDKNDAQGILAHVYTIDVNKAIRGKVTGTIQVYEGNDSGRATFAWTRGKKYLLFLFYVPQDKSWELDGCGNSGPLEKAKAALSEIETIKSAHDGGAIYGTVSQRLLSIPFSGAHVEVQGENSNYAATTNEKGEFQIKVPAGRYSVRVIERGVSFGKFDISYEDPREVQIEPGGCAQIQFAEVEGSQ
jgi:hypothetical protein